MGSIGRDPIFIERGTGNRVTDVDGELALVVVEFVGVNCAFRFVSDIDGDVVIPMSRGVDDRHTFTFYSQDFTMSYTFRNFNFNITSDHFRIFHPERSRYNCSMNTNNPLRSKLVSKFMACRIDIWVKN